MNLEQPRDENDNNARVADIYETKGEDRNPKPGMAFKDRDPFKEFTLPCKGLIACWGFRFILM